MSNQIAEAIDEIRERCERIGGEDAVAIVEALDVIVGEPHHILHIGLQGWSIQHPVICRGEAHPMFNCEVHKRVSAFMQEQDGPPIGNGEWPIYDLGDFMEFMRVEATRA